MASKSYEKLVEEISKLTVLELSELVKALETEFGVSAAMPMAAAPSAAAATDSGAAKAEEKANFKVSDTG